MYRIYSILCCYDYNMFVNFSGLVGFYVTTILNVVFYICIYTSDISK